MVSETSEKALEATIEKALTGVCREELGQGTVEPYRIKEAPLHHGLNAGHGYELGWPQDFDREFAVDTSKFWLFLQKTQREYPNGIVFIEHECNLQLCANSVGGTHKYRVFDMFNIERKETGKTSDVGNNT